MNALPKRSESHATCASACRGLSPLLQLEHSVSQGFWSAEVDRSPCTTAQLARRISIRTARLSFSAAFASPSPKPAHPMAFIVPMVSMMLAKKPISARFVFTRCTWHAGAHLRELPPLRDLCRAGDWRPPTFMRSCDRLCSTPFVSLRHSRERQGRWRSMAESLHPQATRQCRIGANALQDFALLSLRPKGACEVAALHHASISVGMSANMSQS